MLYRKQKQSKLEKSSPRPLDLRDPHQQQALTAKALPLLAPPPRRSSPAATIGVSRPTNPNANPNFHVKSPNLSGSAGVGATGVAATSKKHLDESKFSMRILHFWKLFHHVPSLETSLFFLFTTCLWWRVTGSDFLTVGSLWFFHARLIRSGFLLHKPIEPMLGQSSASRNHKVSQNSWETSKHQFLNPWILMPTKPTYNSMSMYTKKKLIHAIHVIMPRMSDPLVFLWSTLGVQSPSVHAPPETSKPMSRFFSCNESVVTCAELFFPSNSSSSAANSC